MGQELDYTAISLTVSVVAPIVYLIFKLVAKRTPTTIDDEIVTVIDEAIKESKHEKTNPDQ